MEDKRIRKTKKNLKQTLIALLGQKPFEQITVTELCKSADTSRITFYAHYNDKYELAAEVFQDMLKLAEVEKTTQLLASEIEKTRRRVNALEYVMIPELEGNIKYITMKLEENDNATKVRLLKVKEMVLAKSHDFK